MQAGSNARLNILSFIEGQRQERYPAFVIHDQPLAGKTTLARGIKERVPKAIYLDVLGCLASGDYSEKPIDLIDPLALLEWVLARGREAGAGVVLVDEFDLLIHVWGSDLSNFRLMVEGISSTLTKAPIGFFMQSHPGIDQWELLTSGRKSRLLTLDQIAPLQG